MALQRAHNLNPQAIYAALSGLQVGGSDPFVDGEFQGGECRIFKVSFKDGSSVSVRVNHPVPVHRDQQDVIDNIKMDTRILRTLEEKGFPWSLRYRAASLTFDNPINYPFIVLDWAEGISLKWGDDFPSSPIREIVLTQLAEIQMCLKPAFSRVKNGKLPGLTEKDCLDQLALLPEVLGQDGDCRLFAVDHGDLKPANIIVDQENSIKCIIDWSFAATVPIVQAAKLPCFLWADDSATRVPSQAMLKDRQIYIDSISAANIHRLLGL